MYIYDTNTDTVNIPDQQAFASVASLGISGDGKTVIGIADEKLSALADRTVLHY